MNFCWLKFLCILLSDFVFHFASQRSLLAWRPKRATPVMSTFLLICSQPKSHTNAADCFLVCLKFVLHFYWCFSLHFVALHVDVRHGFAGNVVIFFWLVSQHGFVSLFECRNILTWIFPATFVGQSLCMGIVRRLFAEPRAEAEPEPGNIAHFFFLFFSVYIISV